MIHPFAISPADSAPGLTDEDRAELARIAGDWWWRITSGAIYKIKLKARDENGAEIEDDAAGLESPFIPNAAQIRFLKRLHNRNIILKARQLGFSTLAEILALDVALFQPDRNVIVIAQDLDAAGELFRDKIRYAYDRLPDLLKRAFPLAKSTESALIFSHNNSAIRVLTSARSGTVHFLHVSEMGKIAANFPDKARELTTGSLQAVPMNGLCIIESTSEGQGGAFYELARRAEVKWRQGKDAHLTPQDYRFHFFPWWEEPGYSLPPEQARRVPMDMADHEYFDAVEDDMGCVINLGQRAWYCAKRDEEFAHEPSLMWREYPSTPEECWKSGNEGRYLTRVLARAQADGRIGKVPARSHVPVNGFWDIGASDTQVCWLHQEVGGMDHFIGYRESQAEGFLPFIAWIDSMGLPVGTMFLPHDASHMVNGVEQPTSLISQLRAIRPSWDWRVVPRVPTIQHGIDLMRGDFSTYHFDEVACKTGLARLAAYKRKFSTGLQAWLNEPEHDDASHTADALRQKAQGYRSSYGAPPKKPARRISGMAA